MKPWRIMTRFVMIKKLKLSLTSLKMRTRNHWRIKSRVEDLMLVILKRLKNSLKSLNFRFGFNFYSIKCINSLTFVLILQCFHVLLELFLFKVVRLSFKLVNITTLKFIPPGFPGIFQLFAMIFNKITLYRLFQSKLITTLFTSIIESHELRVCVF
jgi:hypothetical protein